jgi:hypothetical protein
MEEKQIRFSNGAVYTGEVNEAGKAHGKGIMTYTTGTVYDGNWINGIADGYGIEEYSNGDRYEGE